MPYIEEIDLDEIFPDEEQKHGQFKEKLAAKLAEVFDCPCNFSPFDEEIGEWCCDKYGDCAEISNKECWLRVFEKIEKGE